jgi:DNA-binding transcriptional ArsR family regulator
MTFEEDIANVASIIGDKTRATMLVALMEGRSLTAGELALRANISPQTASNHLKKMMDAKLIKYVPTPTRYRYYQISSTSVASALESLSLLTDSPKVRPPRHEKLDRDICYARTCYDHLAGELGVLLTKKLQQQKYLQLNDSTFLITEAGRNYFKTLGIDCATLEKHRRQLAKPCLDWTEREYHIAGSLGDALLNYLLDNRLIIRSKEKSRVIKLTTAGQLWLKDFERVT